MRIKVRRGEASGKYLAFEPQISFPDASPLPSASPSSPPLPIPSAKCPSPPLTLPLPSCKIIIPVPFGRHGGFSRLTNFTCGVRRGAASGKYLAFEPRISSPDASPVQPSTFISAIAQPTSAPYKGGENN